MTRFRACYANCAKWEQQRARWPRLIRLLKRQHASVYLLTEAPDEFLRDLALALGWTSNRGDTCWITAPNRNSVLWNPRKWWFRQSDLTALSRHEGDVADGKNRTAAWALLQRRTSGRQVWLGASHLSPNAGRTQAMGNLQRTSQARALVGSLPGSPLLLGIDRNCNPSATPALFLEQGLDFLTPKLGDTFAGRAGRQTLDGLYGHGVSLRWVRKVDPHDTTDHHVLRAGVTVTGGASAL